MSRVPGDLADMSFLGTGWSFPPEFSAGGVRMTSGEDDIHASLRILFGTAAGERFLQPSFGLDLRELLFEPLSTTMRTFLSDRITTAILVHEPRIQVLALDIATPDPNDGSLQVRLDYRVRATNSRFNLVFPFYAGDASEMRDALAAAARA